MRRPIVHSVLAGFLILSAAGCGGQTTAVPNPPPLAPFHLYTATLGGAGSVASYISPLSGTSAPSAMISPLPQPYGIVVDGANSRLFVSETNVVAVYALPLTSASTPAFTMALPGTGGGGGMALDAAGNLYVTTSLGNGRVSIYTPPFSAASVPSTIHTGFAAPSDVAIDTANNRLYVADNGAGQVLAYALPFTAASAPIATLGAANGVGNAIGVEVDSTGRLIVSGNGGTLKVYATPVSSASTPAFTVTAGTGNTGCMAFDATGNLYVGSDNGTRIFAPPLTAASVPSTIVAPGSTPSCVTVGP